MKKYTLTLLLLTVITIGLHGKAGKLEVICGSMFSGKSEELIRRVRRATIAQQNCKTFKHSFDDRYKSCHIVSHNGTTVEAEAHKTVSALETIIEDDTIAVVALDEAQFFSDELVDVIVCLIKSGKRVIVAGLDLDFKGEPFGCMPQLMARADSVTKLQAICTECGADAHFSQRLVDGIPARYDDPLIVVGAQESYQARCRSCYVIDK